MHNCCTVRRSSFSTISSFSAFVIAYFHFVVFYALLIIQLRCKLVYAAIFMHHVNLRILNANHLFCIEMINYHITDWNIETLRSFHKEAQSLRLVRVSSRKFANSFCLGLHITKHSNQSTHSFKFSGLYNRAFSGGALVIHLLIDFG